MESRELLETLARKDHRVLLGLRVPSEMLVHRVSLGSRARREHQEALDSQV